MVEPRPPGRAPCAPSPSHGLPRGVIAKRVPRERFSPWVESRRSHIDRSQSARASVTGDSERRFHAQERESCRRSLMIRIRLRERANWRSSGGLKQREAPVKAAIVFVLATIGFYFAIETAWFTYAGYANPPDREGWVGMGVVFVVGPISAVFLGAGTAYLLAGKEAPHRVKLAARLVGLIILAALIGTVLGF